MTGEYDKYFRLYAAVYFYEVVAWPWFKAQGFAESRLDPDAVSPVGAQGIMQLMPPTALEMARELLTTPNVYDPARNIHFGVRYMRKMWDIFKAEQGIERLRFAMGAYNAGAGNIIKAQKIAGGTDRWGEICWVLDQVTGPDNARQTIDYVAKIELTRLQLIAV